MVPEGEAAQVSSERSGPLRLGWVRWIGCGLALFTLGASPFVIEHWREQRIARNESAAVAMLKTISSAQFQVRASGAIDANRNGAGEFGFFAELAGSSPLRSASSVSPGHPRLDPPILAAAWGKVHHGRVVLGGYVFQMFLPKLGGGWVGEAADGGGLDLAIVTDGAESRWLCYAWPAEYGSTGVRCFFVNETGNILATRNSDGRLAGGHGPTAGSDAFVSPNSSDPAAPATNCADCLGNRWTVH